MRETGYDQKLVDRICERMATGQSLRSICREEGMPSEATVRRWAVNGEPEPAFTAQYARAREAQVDAMADLILEITDEDAGSDDDTMVKISRARVRADTMKWIMSKIAPRKYGDKVEVEHGGKIGLGITKIERIVVDPRGELIEDAVFAVLPKPDAEPGV